MFCLRNHAVRVALMPFGLTFFSSSRRHTVNSLCVYGDFVERNVYFGDSSVLVETKRYVFGKNLFTLASILAYILPYIL